MFGAFLCNSSELENHVFTDFSAFPHAYCYLLTAACHSYYISYRWLPFCQCPCLIKYDCSKFHCPFKIFTASYKNPGFCAFANPDHEGCGCGNAEGAWTGYNKNCNKGHETLRKIPGKPPPEKTEQGSRYHSRYKITGCLVSNPLYRRCRCLGLFNHFYNLAQCRLCTDPCGPELEHPCFIYCCSNDIISSLFFYGYTLSCYHLLINCRGTLYNNPVSRNLLPGSDHHHIIYMYKLSRYFHLLPFPDDACCLRLQVHQLPYSSR